MRHLSEEQLILHYYGETGRPEAIRHHLSECASCRAQWQALERALASVVSEPAPERPADYGERVWRRIEGGLVSRRRQWSWPSLFQPRRLVWAVAAASVLVAAFLAGRLSNLGNVEPEATTANQVRERVLLVALGEHLERSQMLLMELANEPGPPAGEPGTIDISYERRWAEELVSDNRLYRQTAGRTGEAGLTTVLDELERMLIDIAHSPDHLTEQDLESLRRRMEAQGVLFKVRVLSTNVRERERRFIAGKRL